MSTPSVVLTGAASAFPPAEQQSALWEGFFAAHFGNRRAARAAFAAAGVDQRHAAVSPLVEDVTSWSTARRMSRYLVEALPLAKQVLGAALDSSGVAAGDVGLLVVASCTGYVTPGLDVHLARDLAMAVDLQRVLVGHVGCHAALPALALARDYVAQHGRPAALLCVELPSLHAQPPSDDLEQVVVHALFGDAASGLILEAGSETARESAAEPGALEVLEVAAVSDLAAADHMSWTVTDLGFRMSLSRRVPDVVAAHVETLVDSLLGRHHAGRDDVARWAIHPGGSRVLDVVGQQLGLDEGELASSRTVLAEHGNCSSATILVVLDRIRRVEPPAPGELVVALAFGPGLSLYAALLRAR